MCRGRRTTICLGNRRGTLASQIPAAPSTGMPRGSASTSENAIQRKRHLWSSTTRTWPHPSSSNAANESRLPPSRLVHRFTPLQTGRRPDIRWAIGSLRLGQRSDRNEKHVSSRPLNYIAAEGSQLGCWSEDVLNQPFISPGTGSWVYLEAS